MHDRRHAYDLRLRGTVPSPLHQFTQVSYDYLLVFLEITHLFL
jgi:hypothetical protein